MQKHKSATSNRIRRVWIQDVPQRIRLPVWYPAVAMCAARPQVDEDTARKAITDLLEGTDLQQVSLYKIPRQRSQIKDPRPKFPSQPPQTKESERMMTNIHVRATPVEFIFIIFLWINRI